MRGFLALFLTLFIMDVIPHGIPTHNFYEIVLPLSIIESTIDSTEPDYVKPIQDFIDPHTKERFKARIHKISTMSVAEYESQSALSLMAYGKERELTIPHIYKVWPEIKKTQMLRYVILEKL